MFKYKHIPIETLPKKRYNTRVKEFTPANKSFDTGSENNNFAEPISSDDSYNINALKKHKQKIRSSVEPVEEILSDDDEYYSFLAQKEFNTQQQNAKKADTSEVKCTIKNKNNDHHISQSSTNSKTIENQNFFDVSNLAKFSSGVWWNESIPSNREELAVHPKKVEQVHEWLDKAINHPETYYKFRMLVLLGPSGSGKTATLRLLAKELDCEVSEWINPVAIGKKENNQEFKKEELDDLKISQQFAYFLQQARKYSSLNFSDSNSTKTNETLNNTDKKQNNLITKNDASNNNTNSTELKNAIDKKKIILVEDIPNLTSGSIYNGFINAIRDFLRIPAYQSYPLVMIFSDSSPSDQLNFEQDEYKRARFRNNNNTNNENSGLDFVNRNGNGKNSQGVWQMQSIYDILPTNILDSAYCQKLTFNPVAKTILLKLLVRTALRKSSKMIGTLNSRLGENKIYLRITGNAESELKQISELSQGDIRVCMNKLQMIWPSTFIIPANNSSLIKETIKSHSYVISVSRPTSLFMKEMDFHISKYTQPKERSGKRNSKTSFFYNRWLNENHPTLAKDNETANSNGKTEDSSKNSEFVISGFGLSKESDNDNDSESGTSNTQPVTLFHALGKVLYAKRKPTGELESNPNSILRNLPVDFDLFMLYLHQNYSSFTDNVDDYSEIAENLSLCDMLMSSGAQNPQYHNVMSSISAVFGVRSLMYLRKVIPSNSKFYQQVNTTGTSNASGYNKNKTSGSSLLVPIQKPEMFDFMKSKRLVRDELSVLQSRFSKVNIGNMDVIPYLSKILLKTPDQASKYYLSVSDVRRIHGLSDFENNLTEKYILNQDIDFAHEGLGEPELLDASQDLQMVDDIESESDS
ncbi:hypothetical protein BB559_003226 [Furculomyces boomerangus]|uniref:Checkpoint protein RAD24-like helical bundle domain-containing protein n=1 Tax=Furculomyces boomerangus TaxID=61424 RepID=A0A2T9YMQ4_9FUNG|nr:hypothetical protein BB559_003226 [Furculomyces boomerangus]